MKNKISVIDWVEFEDGQDLHDWLESRPANFEVIGEKVPIGVANIKVTTSLRKYEIEVPFFEFTARGKPKILEAQVPNYLNLSNINEIVEFFEDIAEKLMPAPFEEYNVGFGGSADEQDIAMEKYTALLFMGEGKDWPTALGETETENFLRELTEYANERFGAFSLEWYVAHILRTYFEDFGDYDTFGLSSKAAFHIGRLTNEAQDLLAKRFNPIQRGRPSFDEQKQCLLELDEAGELEGMSNKQIIDTIAEKTGTKHVSIEWLQKQKRKIK